MASYNGMPLIESEAKWDFHLHRAWNEKERESERVRERERN